jgi:hypothetical protein
MAHMDEAWNNKIFPNALESATAASAEHNLEATVSH